MVAASTGKPDAQEFLRQLGASEILSRQETSAESMRPLESEHWAGSIDTVGGASSSDRANNEHVLSLPLRYGQAEKVKRKIAIPLSPKINPTYLLAPSVSLSETHHELVLLPLGNHY
jgi:hypothetical protein